jgi:hypothetical protein
MSNFLLSSGLLFEINRQIMNPVGYNLKLQSDGKINIEENLDKVFSETNYQAGRKKFEKWMNNIGLKRMNDRFNKLGFSVQTHHNGAWGKACQKKEKAKPNS